jgi:hypothetical protein
VEQALFLHTFQQLTLTTELLGLELPLYLLVFHLVVQQDLKQQQWLGS